MYNAKQIKIDVDYYNDEHKNKILTHKYANRFAGLVQSGLTQDRMEFLVNAMFSEQEGRPRFRNYSELKDLVPRRIDLIEDYIDFNGGTLRSLNSSGKKDVTETIGVATALSLMNQVFSLTQADWERIPETSRRKTMDFQIASDGRDYILVEAKGTVFQSGNLHRDGSLEEHIKEKKKAHLAENANLKSLFGVITGIPLQPGKTAQCLLLDPLFELNEIDPAKYQLIARLAFYLKLIRVISRGQLVRALVNRIEVIKRISNYTELDDLPLVDVYGEPIVPPPENDSSIWNKTKIESKIVGQVFPISKKRFFYFAIEEHIYELMIKQNFEEIRKFSSGLSNNDGENTTINAIVSMRDLEEYEIPYKSFKKFDNDKVIIPLVGDLNFSSSGQVTGLFRLND